MAVEERLRQLLIDLADQMIDRDIKNIKFKQKIPPGKKEKITEALELWDYFEKIGRIDFKDERRTVASLKRIVDVGASSVGLVRFVQRYEARYLTDFPTPEPDRPETTLERRETLEERQETMAGRPKTIAKRQATTPERQESIAGSPETIADRTKTTPESQETMPESPEIIPESPETMPGKPETMPESQETMEESPKNMPEWSETVSESPETMPERLVTMPESPKTMPESPDIMPESPDIMPKSPETILESHRTMPESPKTMPERPDTMPERPETMPERPETMPESPNTIPGSPKTMPESPDIMLESPETMPKSPENMPERPETMFGRPMPESQETMKERQETMPERPETMSESPEFMPERQKNMPERTETMPQATGIDVTTSLTETSLRAVARTTLNRRTSSSTLPFLAIRRNYLPPLPVPCPVSLPPPPPHRSESCPAPTLSDPSCEHDPLPDTPCPHDPPPVPDTPCPDKSLPTEPLPITARFPSPQAASLPLPLPSPLVPDLLSPLPTSAGPVCVLGPELGSGVILSHPQGLAYHAGTDRLYVACWGNGQVVTCGTRGQDPRVLYAHTRPRDVAVSGDGERVYVLAGLTPSSSLHILNSAGELVRMINSVPEGQLGTCWSVVCRGQEVAVLSDDHGVVVFSRDGEFVTQSGLDQMEGLYQVEGGAMAVNDNDGHVFMTDVKTGAVLVLDRESWTRFGDVDMNNADSLGICVGDDGHVCVSRSRAHRVDVYDRQRRLLTSLGGEQGHAQGQFSHPHGLCLLPDGRLVVAEYGNDRLQIFQI